MIRTIAGTARISTKIIKDGSVAGRDCFCEKLEQKFYNRIEKYKHSQFDYIGKSLHSILPTKLIQVEKLPQSENIYNGAVILAQEIERTIPADIVGYIVSLKPGAKKNHFGGVSMEVLMHEIRHLFHYFTNPKIPNRIYRVSKLREGENNFEQFFVNNFQSPVRPSISKIETEKLLKKEKMYKVDILQFLRYKLIEEIGAYNSGEKFSAQYRTKKSHKIEYDSQSQIQTLFLREKLVMITDMLKDMLKAERESLKTRCKVNN
ncbi:hypothetical protein J6O86_06300 [bacterium]|nr:hypothetical protein [bacterium]